MSARYFSKIGKMDERPISSLLPLSQMVEKPKSKNKKKKAIHKRKKNKMRMTEEKKLIVNHTEVNEILDIEDELKQINNLNPLDELLVIPFEKFCKTLTESISIINNLGIGLRIASQVFINVDTKNIYFVV